MSGPQSVLAIDVSNGRWRRTAVADPTIGSGLLAALLLLCWQRSGGRGPAPVVIACGGMHGVRAVGGATAVVCGRSSQSGGYGEARVEGRLGAALRDAGLAALVLYGRAPRLVTVTVTDGEPRLRPADELAGLDAETAGVRLADSHPGDVIGVIGSVGEAGSAAASIVFDAGFPTGTAGLGGALGALGVKSVVLPRGAASGPAAKEPADPVLARVTNDYAGRMASNPLTASEFAEPGFGVAGFDRLTGYQAALNFAAAGRAAAPLGPPPNPADFGRLLTPAGPGCPGCPQNCLKTFAVPGRPTNTGRLHQLALPIWTDQLGIGDAESGVTFNADCHRFGLEHVTIGAMLGALGEAAANNSMAAGRKPPRKDPAAAALFRFGDPVQAADLVRRWGAQPQSIPGNTGRLDDFAAATGCAEHVVSMRNMPLPPFDPRGSQGLATAMALNPAGPRYDVVEHDFDFDPAFAWARHAHQGVRYGVSIGGLPLGGLGPDRVRSVIGLWQLWSGLDALGVCIFASPPTRELTEGDVTDLVGAATGAPVTMTQLALRGRQRLSVQRRLNYAWGVGERVEVLPDRFHDESVGDGPLAGLRVSRSEFAAAVATIRDHFGWSDAAGGADDRDGIDALIDTALAAERFA